MENGMYVRDNITLIIIKYLHVKSVDFVLSYTQAEVKSGIFMDILI